MEQEYENWISDKSCGTFWMNSMVPGVSTLCKDHAFSAPHIDQCCLNAESVMLTGYNFIIFLGDLLRKSPRIVQV